MSEIEITTVEIKETDYSKIVKGKYMPKAEQIEIKQPEKGIDNIRIVLEQLKELSRIAKEIFSDGKITLADGLHLLPVTRAAWSLVKALPKTWEEITDLDEGEIKYISSELISSVFGYIRK